MISMLSTWDGDCHGMKLPPTWIENWWCSPQWLEKDMWEHRTLKRNVPPMWQHEHTKFKARQYVPSVDKVLNDDITCSW